MTSPVSLLAFGQTGLLAEVAGPRAAQALYRALAGDLAAGQAPPPVLDLVPAERTVLVRIGAGADRRVVADWIIAAAARPTDRAERDDADQVTLDVRYDGPDLEEVGRLTGLGVPGLILAHTTSAWRVGFCGFVPGFGYLLGGDPRLRVPRLPVPRVRVPAGAVALAGSYGGVYPRASPGGWRIIGTTDTAIWDVDRDPPALLRPGVPVRFRDHATPGRPPPTTGAAR